MDRPLALHGEPTERASRPSLAIAAKGFRPFFGLAGAYAVAIVPLWLGVIGGAASPIAYLDPPSWHAHEMIFGFTVAVIAGFLLTAVGNWTQRETLVGAPLLALAGVWVVGRVATLLASRLPRGVPAAADLAFLPLLILILAPPLVATKNRRNFVILGVLAALFVANVVIHLDALSVLPMGTARRGCSVAVDVVVLLILLIAGRVFPMFTRNASGVTTIRSNRVLDIATIAGMAVIVVVEAVATDPRIPSVLAGVVGLLAAARAVHWGARHASREPLLWILHAGYAWLVLGLVMRTVAVYVPAVPSSLATHAITVGAIGSLTLGMMARVSLGHTGRALVAAPATRWAFVAITIGAFSRVVVPIVAPDRYLSSLIVAGALWSLAFMTFLAVHAPILWTPRRDGKPG